MSRDIRNLEDVKRKLQGQLDEHRAELDAWEKVEIVKKKDGTDFAVRTKSFKNAKWTIPAYSDDLHPELVVVTQVGNRWTDFKLDMYVYTDTLSELDERKNNGKKYASFMRETYVFSPEEAMNRIKCRIVSIKACIERLEAQLVSADEIYSKFFDKISEAFTQLKSDCSEFRDDNFPSSIEYAMFDVLVNSRYSIL